MASLQPCAFLLLVGPDWRIEGASANAAGLGKASGAELVGRPLTDLLDGDEVHALRNHMARLSSEGSRVQDYGLGWGGGTHCFDVAATRVGNRYLIEVETATEPRLHDPIGMVRSLMERVEGKDWQALADLALRQVRALTGFDRIALCSGGSVVARSERSTGVLAASLPFETQGDSRVIEDIAAEPVALVGAIDEPCAARAALLAPSDNERDALEVAGGKAAMALPLAIDGERVAMLQCLHPRPRRCGAERRAVAGLFAELLVARMARRGWRP
jgi:hypothetical protein